MSISSATMRGSPPVLVALIKISALPCKKSEAFDFAIVACNICWRLRAIGSAIHAPSGCNFCFQTIKVALFRGIPKRELEGSNVVVLKLEKMTFQRDLEIGTKKSSRNLMTSLRSSFWAQLNGVFPLGFLAFISAPCSAKNRTAFKCPSEAAASHKITNRKSCNKFL